MKKYKTDIIMAAVCLLTIVMIAADHVDAPAVTGTTSDIADFYAFQSEEDNNNMVFVATTQGLLSPGATSSAAFDENVMIEFNIDNNGDSVEDLVIQLVARDGKMYAFGPYAPGTTGTVSTIDDSQMSVEVDITEYGELAQIGSNNGVRLFAGPRDDPFFFDLGQYTAIIGGMATSFNDPGTDALAGTNVMAVAIEVPKSSLGSASTINTWVETKSK